MRIVQSSSGRVALGRVDIVEPSGVCGAGARIPSSAAWLGATARANRDGVCLVERVHGGRLHSFKSCRGGAEADGLCTPNDSNLRSQKLPSFATAPMHCRNIVPRLSGFHYSNLQHDDMHIDNCCYLPLLPCHPHQIPMLPTAGKKNCHQILCPTPCNHPIHIVSHPPLLISPSSFRAIVDGTRWFNHTFRTSASYRFWCR